MTSQGGDLPDWQTRVKLQADQVLQTVSLPPGGGFTSMFDTSQWSSLLISDQQASTHGTDIVLAIGWWDVNGVLVAEDAITLASSAGLQDIGGVQLPVRAPQCTVQTQAGSAAVNLVIYGSGRTVSGVIGQGYLDFSNLALASAAYVVGQVANLGQLAQQGLCQVEWTCGGGTLKGDLDAVLFDGNGVAQDMRLIAAIQQVASGSATVFCGQVIMPASAAFLKFICRVAGTGTVTLNSIALGH